VPDVVEDPSPSNFWKLFLLVAIVLIVVSIIVLVLGKLIVASIIALLGFIFGMGARMNRPSN
jgi:uncharacterized membrane protein required for colicin V production